MMDSIGTVLQRFCFFLTPALFLLVSLSAHAQFEKYSDRPDIRSEQVVARKIVGGKESWEHLKWGHVEALAEILSMYSEYEIYFLARDAELLYDLGKLLTQGDPNSSRRLHLLNVSRANMNHSHLREYLNENGINTATLKQGAKILFVDTGFAGTIPNKIYSLFPNLTRNLRTHLICSSNFNFPSTRTFLAHLNPAVMSVHPSKMHGTIIDYEHLPRYTDRSVHFEEINGHWEAMSPAFSSEKEQGSDGVLSRKIALGLMGDLKYFSQQAETMEYFQKKKGKWIELRRLLDQGDLGGKAQLKNNLASLLNEKKLDDSSNQVVQVSVNSLEKSLDISMVQDFLEIVKLQFPEKSGILPTLNELGLEDNSGARWGNKANLVSEHPEWEAILNDPVKGIPTLIQKHDFQTLRNILDVLQDDEVTQIVFSTFNKYFETHPKAGTQSHVKAGLDADLKNEMKLTIVVALGSSSNFVHFLNEIKNDELKQDPKIVLALAAPLLGTFQDQTDYGGDSSDEDQDEEVLEKKILLQSITALRESNTSDPKILKALRSEFKSAKSRKVRNAALDTLATVPAEPLKFQRALVYSVLNEGNNELAGEARDILLASNFAKNFSDPRVGPSLLEDLAHEHTSNWTRYEIVTILGSLLEADSGIISKERTLIENALAKTVVKSTGEDTKILAAKYLFEAAPQRLHEVMQRVMTEKDPRKRVLSLKSLLSSDLSAIEQADLINRLIETFDEAVDDSPKQRTGGTYTVGEELTVRQEAVQAMGELFLADSRFQDIVQRVIHSDPNLKTREVAISSLGKMDLGPGILPRMPERAAHQVSALLRWVMTYSQNHPQLLWTAIWVQRNLSTQLKDPRNWVSLLRLMSSGLDPSLRDSARQAFMNCYPFGSYEKMSEVERLFKRFGKTEPLSENQVQEIFSKLEIGKKINSYLKQTPLFIGAKKGILENVKILVEQYKVPIDPVQLEGYTPLAVAIHEGHFEVVRYLLEHGANPFHMVGERTLLDIAKRTKRLQNRDKLVHLIESEFNALEPNEWGEPAGQGAKREELVREVERELEKRIKLE